MLIELESLDRTLKLLQHIKPAQHELRRLDAIRSLASVCQRPLEDFLAKIVKFENDLGIWNTGRRRISGFPRRLQWSLMYEEEVKVLRARLAPNVATITILLMTQTIDTLTNAESYRIKAARELHDKFSSHSTTLDDVKRAISDVATVQSSLKTGQLHLTAAAAYLDRDLSILKSKVDDLRDNEIVQNHLRHQATVLEGIQENSTNTKSQNQEVHVIVTSIHQDTAEIKAGIPSILQRALEVMNVVAAGISKAQEISDLMLQMSRLITRFTLEMRETMQRLLQAFGEIHYLLIRLECFLPKRIDLPIIKFRDAFNELRAFPFDLCQDWQTFQGLVTLTFTKRQGLHRVKKGQYFITNFRIGRRLNPTFWHNAVEPGDELSMTMILDDVEAVDGFCPFKSCGAHTKDVLVQQGGKVCPNCFRFAAVSPRRKTSVKRHLIHESSDLDEKTPTSATDSDPVLSTPPQLGPFDTGPAPVHARPRQGFETEDIELYHSIEVVQVLLNSTYEEANNFEQIPSQISGNLLSGESGTLKSGMPMFVRNQTGKSLMLRVCPSDIIGTIKDTIHTREGIPQENQRLIFSDKRLRDSRTLSEYGIQKDNTLQLTLRLRIKPQYWLSIEYKSESEYETMTGILIGSTIDISVKTLAGQAIQLRATNSMQVRQLKEMIREKIGVPVHDQRLVWRGSVFGNNDGRIWEYGVWASTTFHMVKRLPKEVYATEAPKGLSGLKYNPYSILAFRSRKFSSPEIRGDPQRRKAYTSDHQKSLWD